MCGGMIEQHPVLEWRWLLEDMLRLKWNEMMVKDKLIWIGGLAIECAEKFMDATKVQ
jgi:hypothetical protein